MSSEQDVANALPASFDANGLKSALSNPREAFRILDRNGDGRVTSEDLQMLLEQFGVKGMPAKMLAKLIFKKLDADKSGTIEPSDLTHANGILTSLMKMKQHA